MVKVNLPSLPGKVSFEGFTDSQEEIGVFDRDKEERLVAGCLRQIHTVFNSPNKFERRLARMEGVPLESPPSARVFFNVIFSDEDDYYCRGSGGRGGAKVFWRPYTHQDTEKREKVLQDDLCDNCKTASHEAQHGIGAGAEFDFFSDLPMLYNRLANMPKEHWLQDKIRGIGYSVEAGCASAFQKRYQRKARNQLCALNKRFPAEFKEILQETGRTSEQVDQLLRCACK